MKLILIFHYDLDPCKLGQRHIRGLQQSRVRVQHCRWNHRHIFLQLRPQKDPRMPVPRLRRPRLPFSHAPVPIPHRRHLRQISVDRIRTNSRYSRNIAFNPTKSPPTTASTANSNRSFASSSILLLSVDTKHFPKVPTSIPGPIPQVNYSDGLKTNSYGFPASRAPETETQCGCRASQRRHLCPSL